MVGSGQKLVVPLMGAKHSVTADQRAALREFVSLGVSVTHFLERMYPVVRVGPFIPGEREIIDGIPLSESVPVSREDIKWVVQRYIHGKFSGEELSHWAGLLLGISAYSLPKDDDDDDVLGLLTDLALPLRDKYLDRDVLKERLASIA
jgi:hypothetical protein